MVEENLEDDIKILYCLRLENQIEANPGFRTASDRFRNYCGYAAAINSHLPAKSDKRINTCSDCPHSAEQYTSNDLLILIKNREYQERLREKREQEKVNTVRKKKNSDRFSSAPGKGLSRQLGESFGSTY